MVSTLQENDHITNDVELKARLTASSGWTSDPINPRNWSQQRKWLVTGYSCFLSFMVGINALSITSAAKTINKTFDVSDATFPNSYWTVTAWNVGAMLGPVIGLPLMENFGIKVIYFVSYVLFVLFIIPQAVAQNYATLIVTRFFAGAFGGVVQNAVANVIGDLFVGEENTLPAIIFIWVYLTGFTIGPTFGSAIAQVLQWRWIFYIQLILYGALIPPTWLLLRETRGAIIKAANPKTNGGRRASISSATNPDAPPFWSLLYEGTVRPLKLFLTEPVLFSFTIWVSLAISNVFLASQSIAQTYGANHGFDDVQAGYVQSAMVIGETIGLALSIWQGRIHHNSASKNRVRPGLPIPEAILTLSVPASFICTAGGLFIYAWTNYAHIPWIAPTIALGLVGVGIQVVTHSAVAYVTDCYGIYAGSAVAAFAFVENSCSAFLPLSAMSLYTTLGFQWASTLLAFFALILSFAPMVLYLKGPQIRARSKFMTSL